MGESNKLDDLSRKFLEVVNELRDSKCSYNLTAYEKNRIDNFYYHITQDHQIQTIDDISKELSKQQGLKSILIKLIKRNVQTEESHRCQRTITPSPNSSHQEIGKRMDIDSIGSEESQSQFRMSFQRINNQSIVGVNDSFYKANGDKSSLLLNFNDQEEIDYISDNEVPMDFTEDFTNYQELQSKIYKVLSFRQRTSLLEKENQKRLRQFNDKSFIQNDMIAFSKMCSYNSVKLKIIELNKMLEDITDCIGRFRHLNYLNPLLVDEYFEIKNEITISSYGSSLECTEVFSDYEKINDMVSKIEDLYDTIETKVNDAEKELSEDNIKDFSNSTLISLNPNSQNINPQRKEANYITPNRVSFY